MSNVKQIYSILNDVAKQTFGTSAISVIDTASFVSLGTTVLKSDTDTENFLNKLTDRISKTVYSVRNYSGVNKNMLRENFEYGAIVQKIDVSMPEAKENNAWEIGTCFTARVRSSVAYSGLFQISVFQPSNIK